MFGDHSETAQTRRLEGLLLLFVIVGIDGSLLLGSWEYLAGAMLGCWVVGLVAEWSGAQVVLWEDESLSWEILLFIDLTGWGFLFLAGQSVTTVPNAIINGFVTMASGSLFMFLTPSSFIQLGKKITRFKSK